MRLAYLCAMGAVLLAAGCAPPPIYAPTSHPVVLMDEPGLAAGVHVPSSDVLSGSVLARGPWGLYGYGSGEWEAVEDSSVGRDHTAWSAGVGLSRAVPLTDPVRLWVEGSVGVGGGESASQGQEVDVLGIGRDRVYVNERGSYTAQFGTVSLVAERLAEGGMRSQIGFTGRLAYLDYDLDIADPELSGATSAWFVEPGVLLGLGNAWAQLRWRYVWTQPLDDIGFGVRDHVVKIEVSLRVPFSAIADDLW